MSGSSTAADPAYRNVVITLLSIYVVSGLIVLWRMVRARRLAHRRAMNIELRIDAVTSIDREKHPYPVYKKFTPSEALAIVTCWPLFLVIDDI